MQNTKSSRLLLIARIIAIIDVIAIFAGIFIFLTLRPDHQIVVNYWYVVYVAILVANICIVARISWGSGINHSDLSYQSDLSCSEDDPLIIRYIRDNDVRLGDRLIENSGSSIDLANPSPPPYYLSSMDGDDEYDDA
jgi:hypothetical protein